MKDFTGFKTNQCPLRLTNADGARIGQIRRRPAAHVQAGGRFSAALPTGIKGIHGYGKHHKRRVHLSKIT